MQTALQEFLTTVTVNESMTAGMLQLFWLSWNIENDFTYQILDEALESKILEITEVSESGDVPTLKVHNKSDTMVFLMAGEQLIGAKQNRVLNTSIMAPPQKEIIIPVSCVEQGRWGYQSQQFYSKGSSSHSFLRKKIASDVFANYCKGGPGFSKQGEVWEEVHRKLRKMKAESDSEALDQVYEDYNQRIEDTIQNLEAPKTCCGVVFAFGGKIAGMDLFDKPETLTKLLPKLARAYVIDAFEEKDEDAVPVESKAIEEWLQSISSVNIELFQSSGVGTDMRMESENLIGASLVVEEKPVHVELFPYMRPPKPEVYEDFESEQCVELDLDGLDLDLEEQEKQTGTGEKNFEMDEFDLDLEPDKDAESHADLESDLGNLEELVDFVESPPSEKESQDAPVGETTRQIVLLPASASISKLVREAVSSLENISSALGISLIVNRNLEKEMRSGRLSGILGTLKNLVTRDTPKINNLPEMLSHSDERQLVSLGYRCASTQGIRMIITRNGLADHWFTHWHDHEKTAVISLYQWHRICGLPPQSMIASTMILQGLRLLNTEFEPDRLLHQEMRGCLFDFCRNKPEISFKLRTGDICPQCRAALKRIGIEVDPILRMLDEVRKITMNF